MPNPTLTSQRLYNQHLAQPGFTTPAQVVDWLGAVQAQDYAGAKLGVAERAPGLTDRDLDAAFNRGDFLRTHVLRPTWHFVAPADLRWMLALTAPRVHALNAYYYRQSGLDKATLKRSEKVLVRALRGGNHLTRAEITAALEQGGVPAAGLRYNYIMMRAELDGLVVSGPLRGKQQSHALLEERVPPAPPLARDEALAELARRYYTSHGPATMHDFAWWSGLTVADAKQAVDLLAGQLARADADGQTYWSAAAAPVVAKLPLRAYLLSIYDEYIVAYKDRSAIFDEERLRQISAAPRDLFIHNNVIVIGGQVVGTWKRTLSKKTVLIETNPFTPLNQAAQRALRAAGQRYGKIVEREVAWA